MSEMAAPARTVRVGVAALIADANGAMVIGRRKGSSGAGQYGFPGGHQEFGETYFHCAEREALEETGLAVTAVRLVAVTDSVFDDKAHYITLFVECRQDVAGEEAKLMEPEKCYGWERLTWREVKGIWETEEGKGRLFLPIVNLLNQVDIETLTGQAERGRIQPVS